MVVSSKRRGPYATGSNTGTTSKSSKKSKHSHSGSVNANSSHERTHEKHAAHQSNDVGLTMDPSGNNGTGNSRGRPISSSSSSRRITIRNTGAHIHSSKSNSATRPSKRRGTNSSSRRIDGGNVLFDPSLLARGMSGRALGARLPELLCLSPKEIKQDLQWMEAHHNTCISYAQRYFVSRNPGFGCGSDAMYVSADRVPLPSPPSPRTERLERLNTTGGKKKRLSLNADPPISPPPPIDPEEEKRMLGLRKKIAQAENQREILETEYLSRVRLEIARVIMSVWEYWQSRYRKNGVSATWTRQNSNGIITLAR